MFPGIFGFLDSSLVTLDLRGGYLIVGGSCIDSAEPPVVYFAYGVSDIIIMLTVAVIWPCVHPQSD
jgi:hypothetical protein